VKHLQMYSPLTEASFVGRMLQNECGKAHGICSVLQHEKCLRAKKCLGNTEDPAAIKICAAFYVTVMRKEKK